MSQFDMFTPPPEQPETLEELIDKMMGMIDDPLADAGTNVVISRGNPKAKLLLIGEAPGPQENIQGKPFVGRAGQLLDKILQSANFDIDRDVYITNSVFRMPPGDGGKAFLSLRGNLLDGLVLLLIFSPERTQPLRRTDRKN